MIRQCSAMVEFHREGSAINQAHHSHHSVFFVGRFSWEEEKCDIQVLPGAVCGHHVHNPHQAADAVLLLQPYCALCPHLLHGTAWIHPPA